VKLNLYLCDICEKEHRRCDIITISLQKNDVLGDIFQHLCVVCENHIKLVIKERQDSKKEQCE
jgi:hypothetical protein